MEGAATDAETEPVGNTGGASLSRFEQRFALAAFAKAATREAHVLVERPELLWQQLYNRLQWADEEAVEQGKPAVPNGEPAGPRGAAGGLAGGAEPGDGVVTRLIEPELRRRRDHPARPWLHLVTPLRESGALLRTFALGERFEIWATSCCFSHDGALLAAGYTDGTVRLFDPGGGYELARFLPPEGPRLRSQMWHQGPNVGALRDCTFSPDGTKLLSAGADGRMGLWDIEARRRIGTFVGHEAAVNDAAFFPDGEKCVSASSDGTLKLWDCVSGREVATLPGHRAAVRACAVSLDGHFIVSASTDGTLKLWDVESRREFMTLGGHEGPVMCCAISPDGTIVASGGVDRALRLWDARLGHELAALLGHTMTVRSCAFSSDGANIVSCGGMDATVRIWEVATASGRATLAGLPGPVLDCCFSPDGASIATADWAGAVKLWDVAGFLGTPRGVALQGPAMCCAYSLDASMLAVAGYPHTLTLFDAHSGAEVGALEGHATSAWSCAFSPDGRTILSGGMDGSLRTWDVASRRQLPSFVGHGRLVDCCGFLPDGETAFSASRDKTVRLWDVQTRLEKKRLLAKKTGWTQGAAVSSDGSRLACPSEQNTIRVWDTRTGRRVATLDFDPSDPRGAVAFCRFSPDGRGVLASPWNRSTPMKLIDADTGQCIREYTGTSDPPEGGAFSPDGSLVLGGSVVSGVTLWDAETGRVVGSFPTLGWANYCTYSPDGATVCALDTGGNVYILELVGFGSSAGSGSGEEAS